MGPLGPSALRQFQIASSLRPDLQGSLQRSRVNLLCHGGVCAFLRPKVFASKYQGLAGKLSFSSPALLLSPPSEAGFCFLCCSPPSLHTCAWEPGEGSSWGPCPPWPSGLTKLHGLAHWTYTLFAPLLLCSPLKPFIMTKLSKLSKVRNCTEPLISLPTPGRGPIMPSQGGTQATQGSTCL